MNRANIILPHQLFLKCELTLSDRRTYLVEEHLFFREVAFHKQKLAFHRATMKHYANYLNDQGAELVYIDSQDERSDVRVLLREIREQGADGISMYDPCDDWIERRTKASGLQVEFLRSPLFLNGKEELADYFERKLKRFHHNDFYVHQRKKRKILLEPDGSAMGGKWSFDADNRKKYPRGKTPPAVHYPEADATWREAVAHTNEHFEVHPGELDEKTLYYPTTSAAAMDWYRQFLETRFLEFGPYEDAIVKDASILNHSVLTPALNCGLITPEQVLDATLQFASEHEVELNTLEGFVRQLIGWREFIRGVYLYKGREERTRNYWGFTRKIPQSFYTGETGIVPVDVTIKKVLKTGYCHHIERLMILGNFMLLCEFDPDEVYRWFMELFIDSYDWVMVPNVYGMSQFADGGMMSTKPYISGSNYIMKMSDYKKGEWQQVWDGLFWRFMSVHRDFFLSNPRLGMLVRSLDKMDTTKKAVHMENAESFLSSLI